MAKKDKSAKKVKASKTSKAEKPPKAPKAEKPPKPDKKAAKPPKPPKGWVPKGLSTVTASLTFQDSGAAIAFYEKAFGARELSRMYGPDGKAVWHAELRIGDSVIYLADESPMGYAVAARADGRPTSAIQIYVKDCDRWFARAVEAGCRPLMQVADMFWGDRMGVVVDPFNQLWTIGSRTRDLSPKQMKRAGDEFIASLARQQAAPPADATPSDAPDSSNS